MSIIDYRVFFYVRMLCKFPGATLQVLKFLCQICQKELICFDFQYNKQGKSENGIRGTW